MIITLAAGAVIMLGFAVFMFIFAQNSSTVYFGNADIIEERLQQSKIALCCIAVGDLLIAIEKIVPLISSIVMYKKYPDPKGLNILKGTAVTGAVFYSLLFLFLFVGSFVIAFKFNQSFDVSTFQFFMLLAAVTLFPMLKFISMTIMIPSVKRNLSEGVALLSITTAILTIAHAMSFIDVFSLSQTYMIINLNAAAIFLILVFENLFFFLMTRKYLIMLEQEKKKISNPPKKENS